MSNLTELLGDTLVQPGNSGTVATSKTLEGKTVGLYFSAHWCHPCRGFTPVLAERYEALKAAGKDFEIVFVSSDRDEGSFDAYRGEMPWLALPYCNRDKKADLSGKYAVRGIPTLVILDSDGEMITTNGRSAVSADSYVEDFPWITRSEGFFDACLGGDASGVKRWLERDANFVSAEAPEEWHARHVLGMGWQPVVDPPRVVNSSGTVYLQANHPAYGLHLAAANGHADVVRVLLDAGARLELEDGDGDTPLAWATYCGRWEQRRNKELD